MLIQLFGTYLQLSEIEAQKEDRIKRDVCPICGHDLVPLEFVGKGSPDKGHERLSEFEDSYLDELGVPKWKIKPEVKQHYE